MPDDGRRAGRQRSGARRPYPRTRSGYGRRAATLPTAWLNETAGRRVAEFLMPASVILAGVLLVVAFGFIINRAMRDDDAAAAIPLPQPPALGGQVHHPGYAPAVDVDVMVGRRAGLLDRRCRAG